MVWCVFRKYFLSEEERNACVPNINDVLVREQYDYKFINVTWDGQASTEAWKYLGELITHHLDYLNDAFYYVCGYFSMDNSEKIVFNYQNLINVTHNIG